MMFALVAQLLCDYKFCWLVLIMTHGLTNSRTHGHTDSRTHGLTDTRTYKFTYARTYGLTDSRTYKLTKLLSHSQRVPKGSKAAKS